MSPNVDIPNLSWELLSLGKFSLSWKSNMVGSDDKYSLATLKKAVSAVKEDGMSYGAAAKILGVPKPTLYRICSETVIETSQCNSA